MTGLSEESHLSLENPVDYKDKCSFLNENRDFHNEIRFKINPNINSQVLKMEEREKLDYELHTVE